MKKMYGILMALTAVLLLSGCTGSVKEPQVDGTLDELITKVYEGSGVEVPMTETVQLTPENVEGYLGTKDVAFTEGAASEALITSVAHSIVLFRVDPGADIDAIKKRVKESVNPRKWICVGVDESNVVVDNIGNLIILIMDNNSKAFHDSFLKLGE